MRQIKKRLKELERCKAPEYINSVIIYDPENDPGGEKVTARFWAQYPDFDGAIILIPEELDDVPDLEDEPGYE